MLQITLQRRDISETKKKNNVQDCFAVMISIHVGRLQSALHFSQEWIVEQAVKSTFMQLLFLLAFCSTIRTTQGKPLTC